MTNKLWVQGEGQVYRLYFNAFDCPYDAANIIAELYYDEGWCCDSIIVSFDWLESETLEDAKREIENAIADYYADQIAYYTTLLSAFKEGDHAD